MEIITHTNTWWWGKSYTFITNDGKGTIDLAITDDEETNYFGTIRSLMVHDSVRRHGIGKMLLKTAEEKAKELGINQVVLYARKDSFLITWYEKEGYKIYNDNPEYSEGRTVAMNKYF